MRNFRNDYNSDGAEKRAEARARAGNLCIRCGSPSVPGRILTTHHFDGDKSNDVWWNLLPLCQVCHLQFQAKVDPDVPWFLEHSPWLKPYVAGFYAKKYEGKQITMEEALARLDELLAYERRDVNPPASARACEPRSHTSPVEQVSPVQTPDCVEVPPQEARSSALPPSPTPLAP